MEEYTAIAFCALGAEKAVSNELKKLDSAVSQNQDGINSKYRILESGFGRVRFISDLPGLYKALISLRAADRLLLETGNFYAADFDALYENTKNIAFEAYIPRGMALTVRKVRTRASKLQSQTSVQAIVHKAAAECLCRKYGINRLPESGKGVKQAELRVYVERDQVSILLDISGEPLYKRGYRSEGGIAPLRESTAAAIILLSGWRRKYPLYDPFCGTGSIIIEAALYAWNQAPGLGRSFALSDLSMGNIQTEKSIRKELMEKIGYTREICIEGSDLDPRAVTQAKENIKKAAALSGITGGSNGTVPAVKISCLPMEKAKMPDYSKITGFIITNPPYGKRLDTAVIAESRYREMAVLADKFPGWQLALICDHSGFESHFGKKADSVREIKNGAFGTWLYHYKKLL